MYVAHISFGDGQHSIILQRWKIFKKFTIYLKYSEKMIAFNLKIYMYIIKQFKIIFECFMYLDA